MPGISTRPSVAFAQARPFRRLVIVSHRLPVVVETGEGHSHVRRTVGGLASGVEAFLRAGAGMGPSRPPVWVGWPGHASGAQAEAGVRKALATVEGLSPVFLGAALHTRFYDGFSNRTLWPLCHTFPSKVDLEQDAWEAYRSANVAFRDAVLSVLEEGDLVWVHDYQLMLLPALLRERVPDLPIAYFHHIPFPALDVLRVLPDPWARALLTGMLGADVIGLQTHDDVRKILRGFEHLLGVDSQAGAITRDDRVTLVDTFPIGVDFAQWDARVDDPQVQAELRLASVSLKGRQVVLSVDRLDYTKGILNRLLAFEAFLERRPEWRRRATLVAIVVPSRAGVEAYRSMRTQIEEVVGRVNGRYGDLAWTPVLYQYKALDVPALSALYLRADVALVTPLRDGMNLVAKEFLATRRDCTASLVLSDMAGAARELGEAILVNPFHVDGLTEALGQALEMPEQERRRRCEHMRARIKRYDVVRWGTEQVERLREARERTEALRARRLPLRERARMVQAWRDATSRLLMLDYDGTLVPFEPDPSAAAPDAELLGLLARLADVPATRVVVVSGRDAATMETWLGGLGVQLVAEHGARVREAGSAWSTSPGLPGSVRHRVIDLMQVFADRLPGALVEVKDQSLAWHWRASDPGDGSTRARELVGALGALGMGPSVHVVTGKKVVEVREAAAHKGTAARRWAAMSQGAIIVAAGDDETDEDLFAALPPDAWTLRVGSGGSRARFNLSNVQDLRDLLSDLASTSEAGA